MIRIASEGYPIISVDLKSLKPVAQEKFTSNALVRGVCARLAQLGHSIGGFDAVVSGQVPKGSGLSSSAAFEVLIVTILNHLYCRGTVSDIQSAQIAQFAENEFFGKPCGLMDQTACACGGFVTIDFKNAAKPLVKKVSFDFAGSGYALVIANTGGNHADLNDDYAALPAEMKSVARALGGKVLRDVEAAAVFSNIGALRKKTGDRAILRALHFYGDNDRVPLQVKALEKNDFTEFLRLVKASGDSSWRLNQNCFTCKNPGEQGITLALAVSEKLLGNQGAWRVHGGGFAGTIQAYVPRKLLPRYLSAMQKIFGANSCQELMVRPVGTTKLDLC
jgi:galactokinase